MPRHQGRKREAWAILGSWKHIRRTEYVDAYSWRSCAHVGQREKAFGELERALEESSARLGTSRRSQARLLPRRSALPRHRRRARVRHRVRLTGTRVRGYAGARGAAVRRCAGGRGVRLASPGGDAPYLLRCRFRDVELWLRGSDAVGEIVQPPRFRAGRRAGSRDSVRPPHRRRCQRWRGGAIWLEVSNPNAFGFTLTTLATTLSLDGSRAATGDSRSGCRSRSTHSVGRSISRSVLGPAGAGGPLR